MKNIFVFDIDDTIIMHTKDNNDYYNIDSGNTLKNLIESLKSDKLYIYTNGTYGHGYNVLKNLDLLYHFSIIFARDNIPINPPYQMKPSLKSFKYVDNIIKDDNKSTNNIIYFFDDMKENLQSAKEFGWKTIWINPYSSNTNESFIDYEFPNIYQALIFFLLKENK